MKVTIDNIEYAPIPPVPADSGLLAALETRFDSDAGDNLTIRDYLCTLLETLWREGESFSGKRPFGNSGWERSLYKPLITGGFISGEVDEDGYVQSFNGEEAFQYVFKLIRAAFYGVQK